MTEYEITYADVVPKDQQAVTIRKVEEDRHHEVILCRSKKTETGRFIAVRCNSAMINDHYCYVSTRCSSDTLPQVAPAVPVISSRSGYPLRTDWSGG